MSVVSEVRAALRLDDPEVRRRSAVRLRGQRAEDVAELVVLAMGDTDWRVRKEATAVAVTMAPATEVLERLMIALQPGENVGLRNAAVEALSQYGSAAVTALGQSIETLDADGKKLAAEALATVGDEGAVELLEQLLADDDPNVCASAVEALSVAGSSSVDAVVPLLDGCLDGDDSFLRLAALDGLNRLGIVLPWERVAPLLEDRIMRRAALLAAGRSRDPRAAGPLVSALDEARGSIWEAALAALAELAHSGDAALAAARRGIEMLGARGRNKMVHLVGDPAQDVERRRIALLVCGVMGGAEAAEAAISVLSDDDVGAQAEEALALIGAPAVPLLVEHAGAGAEDAQAASLELLGRLGAGPDQDAAVLALIAALESSPRQESAVAALRAVTLIGDARCLNAVTPWLREDVDTAISQAAEQALFACAHRFPDAAAELARGASSDGPDTHAAVVVLAAVGGGVFEDRSRDIEFLTRATSHASTHVRKAAIEALARVPGGAGADAVAFAVGDEQREVQFAAARALGALRDVEGRPTGVGHLLELVENSGDEMLVAAAIRSLGEVNDGRVFDVLVQLTRTGSVMSAVSAVEALAGLGDPRRLDALIDATSHAGFEVVKAALSALADTDDPRGMIHLGACLDHEAWDVRRLSADLLGRLGTDASMSLLRARLPHESEPLVKEAITRALGHADGTGRLTTPPPRPGSNRP